MLDDFSVIQGLKATKILRVKGLKAKGFFNKEDIYEDDRMRNDKTTVTLLLRAPLVAIGAQKGTLILIILFL